MAPRRYSTCGHGAEGHGEYEAHGVAGFAPGHNDIGEDLHQEMIALLKDHTDGEVATILNQRGRRTVAGETFNPVSIQWARSSAKIPSLQERLVAAGWLTTNQTMSSNRCQS